MEVTTEDKDYHLCTLAIFIFDSKQTDFVWS